MASKTDTQAPPVVEIAEKVTPEVENSFLRAALRKGPAERLPELEKNLDQVHALVAQVYAAAGVSPSFSLPEEESASNELQIELNDATTELSPEILGLCLKGLESDFKRGIVAIDENSDAEAYETALEADRSAGTTWEAAQERLLANDSALLKKAATMQGKGELIGVFKNGELCIVDRADTNGNREPVITAFDAENNRITITTDTPDRANTMKNIAESGKFANYWEILRAVTEAGFTVPQDSPEYEKKGIVAAVEAVSGNPFVRSQNGKEWRSAILDCGNVSRSAFVRVVSFNPNFENALVIHAYPCYRNDNSGAVRVLRG